MRIRRFTLLLIGTGLILGVTACEPPAQTLNLIGAVSGDFQSTFPHSPHLLLPDLEHQMHLWELDSRVVEAIIVAPASRDRALLMERLVARGFDPEQATDTLLHEFLKTHRVLTPVLVPNAEFEVRLKALNAKVVTGTLTTAAPGLAAGAVLPLGNPGLWSQELAGPVVDFTIWVADVEIRGTGTLYQENISVGRLLNLPLGPNQGGIDECIKLSSCELFCDTPE